MNFPSRYELGARSGGAAPPRRRNGGVGARAGLPGSSRGDLHPLSRTSRGGESYSKLPAAPRVTGRKGRKAIGDRTSLGARAGVHSEGPWLSWCHLPWKPLSRVHAAEFPSPATFLGFGQEGCTGLETGPQPGAGEESGRGDERKEMVLEG